MFPGVRTFAEDLKRGLERESVVRPRIATFMNRKMVKTTDPYHPMDFVDEEDANQYGEHKDRSTFTYATLRDKCGGTVWVGKNKVDYIAKTPGARCDFFFSLKDGLYKATFDDEFPKFPSRFHARDRPDKKNDGGYVVDIPLTKLVKVQ